MVDGRRWVVDAVWWMDGRSWTFYGGWTADGKSCAMDGGRRTVDVVRKTDVVRMTLYG